MNVGYMVRATGIMLWRACGVIEELGLKGVAWMRDYRRLDESVEESAKENAPLGLLLKKADLTLCAGDGCKVLQSES